MSNCLILRNVSLIESVQNYLYEYDSSSNETTSGHKTKCGIFSNSKYIWYAKGPKFEVVETRTGRRITSWTFGSILRDTTTKVNCLAEIPCFTREIPLVILGLECSLTGGSICVFDILTSKVLRAIQVNDKVSYVHVVDCGSNIFQILGPLRAFDGVVAVGLAGGDVLLVDLCQQCIDDVRSSISAEDIKDEMDPCQLMSLTVKDINEIEHHKQIAAASGDHLAIYLNAVLNSKLPHFTLKGPKGDDRVHVNKVEVVVTSIFYCSQLGSLLVGYNFGAWQIWDIINMVLIYTSPIYEENIPVSHFTVQEPADDPRAFCYVWAVYSHAEQDNVGFPFAVLYSLSYETKDFHEGYGYLYQNLQSCAVRFQIELSSIDSTPSTTRGACCLRLTSHNKGLTNRQSMQDSHEDLLTICYMVWNVWHVNRTDTYISIFDLNQWYKAQMPSVPQGNCSTYLSYICVSDLLNGANNNSQLLDAYIDESSITQFLGIQKPEEHYYPTSLSYQFSTCSDSSITFVYNKGHQRALLSYFDSTGPLILSKPMDVFQQAIKLGLTPLFTEVIASDLNLQREFLMNVALENQMTAFLCKCASTWSNGSFACIGCSLDFFLKWCWNRVITLKTNADKLCEPLFDYSGASIDANNQKLLNNCVTQLSNLHSIYKFMCRKLDLFELTAALIQQQEKSLHMIVVYLEVLQWLVNIGLLPEFSESTKSVNKLDETAIPYPIDSLLAYYKERRSLLQSLDPNNITRKKPLLYIDHLIENKMGEALQKFWEDDGGNGYYPPPSLQSLLRTYLIEKVDLLYKHSLVIYVFLDLAMSLDQSRYKFVITHLIKFPSVFRIETSLIKTIQAFWQLDHGEFSNALEQLSDPMINTPDLDVWHHRIILNALLLQGQHNFALLYYQIRKPPIENTDDIIKVLSMYVLNHLIDEAMTFARQYSSKDNDHELLVHVFKECEKTKQIPKLLYYPLTPKEEDIFMRFLKDISFSQLEEFQVSYYLNRSRYLDIFKMDSGNNDKIKPSGLGAQNIANYRGTIMKTIQQCKVTKHIMDVYRCERGSLRSEVSRPQPMSVIVHSAKQQPVSKSSLIRTGIMKAKEIWSHPILESSLNQELPFIGTPSVTPSVNRKRPSICSKIITSDTSKTNEDYASPQKRMKMSPRKSLMNNDDLQLSTSEINASGVLSATKLLTPIVRRKTTRPSDSYKFSDKFNTYTPQSILKVRSRTTTPCRNLDNILEKHKDDDTPVQKNVTLISPKGRSSYKHRSLSNETSSELESDPDTINTEPSPAMATHIVKEKCEDTPITRVPLSTRKICHPTREESEEPVTTSKSQLQSPPILSPRRTTRSMRGKSEEPMPSPTMESESSLLLSPRRTSRSTRGRSEEPVPYPTVQSASPLPLSPRRSSRFTRGKSEEPLPSPNIQSASFVSRKTSHIMRGKSEEPRPSSSSSSNDQSDLPLTQSPRRLSRTLKETSKESSSTTKVEIQSTSPLSPRRPSLRVSSRKSLSRKVLENNAFSMGTPQIVIQPDHREASNTQALEGDGYSASTEDIAALDNQEAIDVAVEDTSVVDTEKADDKNNVGMEEGASIEEKEESEKKDTVPVRRRSSFKLKSRKSLSRMVLENNAFSLHESGHAERERSSNISGISGMSSLDSVEFDRFLAQQKVVDISDFSLSPTRYSSSNSMVAVTEAFDNDDDDKNQAEVIMEDQLPKSPGTSETEKENPKPEIEQRRINSIKSRRSIERSEYNRTSISTSTPSRSKLLEKSEGEMVSNVSDTGSWTSEEFNRLLRQQKFSDTLNFSLSPTRYDSTISTSREACNVDEHVENDVESIMEDRPLKSPGTLEIRMEKEDPVDISIASQTPEENNETNQLQADVDGLELEKEIVSKEEEQVTSYITTEIPEEQEKLEQLVEENEKDVEISSNVIELSSESTEMNRELTTELSEEIDELNQAQLISSDVIEIGDSSSSSSERTSKSTSDGSDISNASTFVDERLQGNYTNENSVSDDVSNEVYDTSDEFYDANNAILELDTEYIGEDVEGDNEAVSQEITDEETNASTEEVMEDMEADHVELDRSDLEYQSVQTLKTSEENVEVQDTKSKEHSSELQEDVISDQELHEETEKDNSEDKDLEEDSDKKEQNVDEEEPVPLANISHCEEDNTEEVNTVLERLDEIEHEEHSVSPAEIAFSEEDNTEEVNTVLERSEYEIVNQENAPSNINPLTEEDIDKNSKYTELEDNIHQEQPDVTVKTLDVQRLDESEHDNTVDQENGPLNIAELTEKDTDGSSKYTELEDNFHEDQRDVTVKTLDNQHSLHKEEINTDLQTLEDQEDHSNIILENQNQVVDELLPSLDEKEQSREVIHSVIRTDDSVLVELDKSEGMDAGLEEIMPEKKIDEENPTSIKDNLSNRDDLTHNQDDDSSMSESVQVRISENIEAIVEETPDNKTDDVEELKEVDFDNMTIEPSTVAEITLTDIFDMNDIDKTAHVDVTVTDILEQTLPEHCDNSTITEHDTQPHLEKINKERANSRSNEALEPMNDKRKSAKDTQTEKLEKAKQDEKQSSKSNVTSSDSPYSMHLRKRSLSGTSFKKTINRTPRKRSASVEETSTKLKILASTPSTSTEKFNESQVDFDNMTIEPSTVAEITLTDIFDMNDIDKTAHVDVTVTDILEQTLPEHCDNSTITEHDTHPHLEKINKESESSQSNETVESMTHKRKSAKNTRTEKLERAKQDEKQTSGSDVASPDSHYSSHLRKRSLSSTSFESTINRTPRKRSASVEETSTKPQILASTSSTSTVSPARRKKRTASVSSLPVIVEEPNKPKEKGKRRQLVVEIKKEEKQVVDDIESYSTSRRLTRNQKNLLQRSKPRTTGKQMNERSIETRSKEDMSIVDDPDLSTSPHSVSESATSARVMTRRMSQESTSSKVSKSSRTTRKSETGDDDDRSSVSLRRSTRHRSKTPDIDVISKTPGSAKKHLSKIDEEIDDEEIKEEPPKKRGKSKK